MFIIDREENGKYELVPRRAEDVIQKLEPGVYSLNVMRTFEGVSVSLTENRRYKDSKIINVGTFKEASEHIDFFLNKESKKIRKEMGMMNKLALIFNGGPGTGKTFLAGQLMEKLVKEENAICIVSKGMVPYIELHAIIDNIRLEDKDRMIGILLDEYEKNSSSSELEMLSFLDGTNSRENIILIATVNSTKTLPDTIVERIGRIEKVYNFDENNEAMLLAMVESVTPNKYVDIIDKEEILNEIKFFKATPTIDFISVLVRNKIYEKITNKKAPKLKHKIENYKKKSKKIGFKQEGNNEPQPEAKSNEIMYVCSDFEETVDKFLEEEYV